MRQDDYSKVMTYLCLLQSAAFQLIHLDASEARHKAMSFVRRYGEMKFAEYYGYDYPSVVVERSIEDTYALWVEVRKLREELEKVEDKLCERHDRLVDEHLKITKKS